MLLREVLSDTPQPSSVEAADQQEHCSLSLKSGRTGSVATSILIASSYKMEQNFGRFSSHIILQPENARSTPAQTNGFRLFQFITVESFISGL